MAQPWVRVLAVAAVAGGVHATAPVSALGAEATAPGTVTPGPAPAEPAGARGASWVRAYTAAREALARGRFDEARRAFAELARTAASEGDRTLASELAGLAGYWAERGDVLVPRSEVETSEVLARRENRRTTDEIAVLYLNSVLYGLGTGAFVATHTQPESVGAAVLPALGLGGASAGVVALVDSQARLGYGVPQSIVAGMYLGLGEGVVLTLWNQARVRYYEEWEEETIANVVWGSTTAGAVLGGALGTVFGTTPGRASYVGSAGLWAGILTPCSRAPSASTPASSAERSRPTPCRPPSPACGSSTSAASPEGSCSAASTSPPTSAATVRKQGSR